MKEMIVTNLPALIGSLTTTASASARPHGETFLTHLQQAIGEVDNLQQTADKEIRQLVGEGKGDLQDTMIALEKADVSFRLMMQIRNKVLDAYQEIVRMQV